MSTLTAQQIARAGLEPTYAACAGSGDEFANSGDEFVHIKNGDGTGHVVTIVTQATSDGLAVADRTVSIPAGEERIIGPWPTNIYNDGTGKVQLTYDDATSQTIAVLKP